MGKMDFLVPDGAAHVLEHFPVALDCRASGSCEHVARNGSASAALENEFAVVGCRCAACSKANMYRRIDVAEESENTAHIVFLQLFHILQRGTLDRHQYVERNRLYASFVQADCHVEAIFPGFTHAHDASGANIKAFFLRNFDGVHFHLVGVRRANIREVALGRFDVVMVASNACGTELLELFAA